MGGLGVPMVGTTSTGSGGRCTGHGQRAGVRRVWDTFTLDVLRGSHHSIP